MGSYNAFEHFICKTNRFSNGRVNELLAPPAEEIVVPEPVVPPSSSKFFIPDYANVRNLVNSSSGSASAIGDYTITELGFVQSAYTVRATMSFPNSDAELSLKINSVEVWAYRMGSLTSNAVYRTFSPLFPVTERDVVSHSVRFSLYALFVDTYRVIFYPARAIQEESNVSNP